MRTGNGKDHDRRIDVYFARKNLEPKSTAKIIKRCMRWIVLLKLFFSVLNRSFCRDQRKKSLAFATTPQAGYD